MNETFLQSEPCQCTPPELRYLHAGANIRLHTLEAEIEKSESFFPKEVLEHENIWPRTVMH